jgi:hypothetical protein
VSNDSWVIGVDWFTISDGDLACLETGQETEFALYLGVAPEWTAPVGADAAICSDELKGGDGEFVDWPLVYSGREMPGVRVGDRFVGRGSCAVHTLGAELDLPFGGLVPPRYNWRIDRIELDKPPLVTVDRTRLSHSRGEADYTLHCALLSGPYA